MRETGLMAKRYILVFIVTMGCLGFIALTRPRMPTPDAFPANTTQHALVSLLSVDGPQAWWSQQKYISAAEKLAHSFRKHSTDAMDMVLLVVDEYGALRKRDELRLRASGWMVHRMRSGIMPEYGGWSNNNNKYYSAKLFSKLWMWRLVMYEKILYTDLDTLFTRSPHQLFHTVRLQATPAMVLDPTRRHHYFNAGVMLLRPSEDEYHRLISAMNANGYHNYYYHYYGEYAEQDFLNIFYHGHIVQLDKKFNRQACKEEGCLNDKVLGVGKTFEESEEKNKTVILHFSGENKPWNMRNCVEQGIVQLCLFWKHDAV